MNPNEWQNILDSPPKVSNVLPLEARNILIRASKAPARDRAKAIDEATDKVRRLFPQHFK